MQALLDAIGSLERTSDACRVFHGRGGLYPGSEHWVLDSYPPVWLVTSFAPATPEELARIGQSLQDRWEQLAPGQPLNWVHQCRHGGRTTTQLMAGQVPEPHVVAEGPARYQVHLLSGQNHGLFLDMAEGRRWVAAHARAHPGLKVLNLFAYSCAFSVVALQAGARQVVNVDMSQGAMGLGQKNHRLNGLAAGASFLVHDIFNTWGKIGRSGPYDLVILDPPSYQKGSFVANKDYVRLMRRLPDLLVPGGHALLCLNAPELGEDFLRQPMQELAPTLHFVERLTNPPAFADVSPQRALKVLVYRAGPSPSADAQKDTPLSN